MSFLPALIIMYMIIGFSSQTGSQSSSLSYQVSKSVVLAYNKILIKGYSNETLNELIILLHPWIRKTAHFTEYFALAVTVAIPLYVYKIRGIFLFLTGGIFCVLFAFLDEYVQSFVLNRTSSLRDVGIDSLGALSGILVAWIFCYIGRKTLFKWLSLDEPRKGR